jgi:MFS family permease
MQYASDQYDPYMDPDDPNIQHEEGGDQDRYQMDQNRNAKTAPQAHPGSKVYSGPAQIACLFALVLANTTTEAARYSLNFLVYPDFAPQLKISGTQYGILSGLGFTVVFVLCLIPWGRASDDYRVGRKSVLAAGLIIQLIFSAMQSLCWDFWSLLVVRFGLAVGQAAIAAPSFAIIAHVVHPNFVATANGIFACGIYLGTGLASVAGILSYLYGWQVAHGWGTAAATLPLPLRRLLLLPLLPKLQAAAAAAPATTAHATASAAASDAA